MDLCLFRAFLYLQLLFRVVAFRILPTQIMYAFLVSFVVRTLK
jgi:hypothetical protein